MASVYPLKNASLLICEKYYFLQMFNLKKTNLSLNQILLRIRVLTVAIPFRNLEDFGWVRKDKFQRKITFYTCMF